MELFINCILLFWGGILFFFVTYQFIFFVLSVPALFLGKRAGEDLSARKTFGIIIPAHNEELLIGELVKSIQESDYPAELYEIFVIADNCTDRTAQIAREAGATCRERTDPIKRGKPYALNWLISQLNLDAFDAYVIIDADTLVARNFLTSMNISLTEGKKVIQGYFGVMNPDENWLTRLSILPGILKYKLHFPGKNLLGLSCPLAGNGMCFSSEIFKKYGWNVYSIVENWEYYVMLTLEGYVVVSNENAVIYSQVAKSLKTGESQRIRWSKGRLQVLLHYFGRLAAGGFRSGDLNKFDALVELMRPSYAIFFGWSVIYLLLCLFLHFSYAYSSFFVWIAVVVFAVQLLYFFSGLIIQRAPLKTWLALGMIPFYILWKMAITLKGLLSYGERKWVKTERHKSTK
ncbi:glycosyltransferase family 2 protein [Desulfopila inferna]|uniref:glycosyltransferase family 2 protein n=1 Tax=Desulfopila inferna TaxID=468528 RepID=UPI00196255B9|nr:glycosyltransferase family 2 protein [Desulfopila inferna]MBM9605726.1 glycosyltransferase family 2 protein [Desulfopila inferna]